MGEPTVFAPVWRPRELEFRGRVYSLWRGNRTDGRKEWTVGELADRFAEWLPVDHGRLSREVSTFLSSPSGMNSTWLDPMVVDDVVQVHIWRVQHQEWFEGGRVGRVSADDDPATAELAARGRMVAGMITAGSDQQLQAVRELLEQLADRAVEEHELRGDLERSCRVLNGRIGRLDDRIEQLEGLRELEGDEQLLADAVDAIDSLRQSRSYGAEADVVVRLLARVEMARKGEPVVDDLRGPNHD